MRKIYKRMLASLMTLCFVCMFSGLALLSGPDTGPDYTNIIDVFSL